ncbi:MAG: hypothetical protein R3B70_23720 [Polyangiaceae bacterium]
MTDPAPLKIHHFSISAVEPERVARALAEILGGRVWAFPAHAGSFMATTGGPLDVGIEVYPLGVELVQDSATKQVTFERSAAPSRHTATHAAISVPATTATIESIAEREGWTAQRVQRGPFDFVEFWVENRVMLELFASDIEKKLRFTPGAPGGGGAPGGPPGAM